MSKNGGNKTRFARRTSLYRIGLVGLLLFKCDEIRLHCGFTVKTTVILQKNVFEFIIGLDQRSGGKVFNNIFSEIFTVCFTWPSGKAMARRVEGPEFYHG